MPGPGSVKVHLILPRSFNDAQQIADRFKDGVPVILNLQSADQDLSKRLIDFASGLTYALDGGMQRVADKVFLLTPRNVEVSAEERAKMLERGGFFNQAYRAPARGAGARDPPPVPVGKGRGRQNPSGMGDHLAVVVLLADVGSSLASFVHVFIWVYIAPALRLHPDVVDPAPVPALAEPGPALPLRRLRPVPAPLPALPAAARAARPLADGRDLRPVHRLERARLAARAPVGKEAAMALTPVEIRHVQLGRGFRGYKRAHVDRLLADVVTSFEDVWRDRADLADRVEQLEADLVRHKELEGLLRTTLVSAESAAQQLREQARTGGGERRRGGARGGARDRPPRERREGTARGRAAPDQVAAPLGARQPRGGTEDAREPVGEATGEIRRLIS